MTTVTTTELTVSGALTEAYNEEMDRDERVFTIGEGIGHNAIYGITGGLYKKYGEKRVIDTPLSETAIVGGALGAAATGLRPIVALHAPFYWVAMDQVVNQVAKMKYMFGGQAKLPIVLRMGLMYKQNIAAHHTDRPHAVYMQTPGLKIVFPATPADAKGLFKTAVREDDPVIFLEDNSIMGTRGPVPSGEHLVPLGVADIKRAGTDVTIVASGGATLTSLNAAATLAQEGISAEVVDLRSLVPMDKQAILDSVAKTGRLVIVDIGPKTCGLAGEVSAIVAEEAFWSLQAPIQRVTSPMVHPPFSPALEKLMYPDEAKVIAAVKRTLG